jgi:hypothetical protein
MPFSCNICEEESTRICEHCTKDTCRNHLCGKCQKCSDCCTCEVPLEEQSMVRQRRINTMSPEPVPTPHPMPDPDPAPDPEPLLA